MATVIDTSLNQHRAWPLPSGVDWDRVAYLHHEAGELDGVLVRAHRYGPLNDVRAVESIKELFVREVPCAVYGNYSPWWSPSYGERLAKLAASRGVTGIRMGGLQVRVVATCEVTRSGYSKQAYSDNLYQYCVVSGADALYSSWNFWNINVGGADNSWCASFGKWVAHYTGAAQPLLPADWDRYDLWQWSADGNGLGSYYGMYSEDVDLDRWNPDLTSPPPPPAADLTVEERVARLEQAVFGGAG